MPSAWSTTIGSTAPWTDHEKNVCSFERAAISSLVIAPGAVEMPMGHLAAGSATWRRPGVSDGARVTVTRRPLQHIRGDPSAEPGRAGTRLDPAAEHGSQVVRDEKHAQREQADEEHLAQEFEREDRRAHDGE